MATKEKVKKKKAARGPGIKEKKKKHHVPKEELFDDGATEDTAGSQVSVREAAKENTKDNTILDPRVTSTPVDGDLDPDPSFMPPLMRHDGKKKKHDLVEEKLEGQRTESPTPSLTAPGERRVSKNTVNPVNVPGGQRGSMGSALSIRTNGSQASLREAWVENAENESKRTNKNSGTNKSRDKSSSVASSVVSLREAPKEQQVGLSGVKGEGDEDSPEKHAYVPYLYARNSIAKIMEDMKQMKNSHIVIVENIQMHYRTIEDETQTQFNMFVICLREEYAQKRKTFHHVIELHRAELDQKEKYWNEMLTSLAERNNRLLKEKKILLVQNTTEIERLEKEKVQITQELTEKIDKLQAMPGPVAVETEGEEAQVTSPGVGQGKETARVESLQQSAAVAGVLASAKDDRKQMDKERKEMEEERMKLSEERRAFELEREGFSADQKQWMDQISQLQETIGAKNKESSEWMMKYETVKTRLDEVAGVQAKYQALESQYATLALLVNSNDNKEAAKEQKQKTEEEKGMMEDEKEKLESHIETWEREFQQKSGRPPTEDDKSDSVKEMYVQREELREMVTTLETRVETLTAVESGSAPDPPTMAPPVSTKDPEVVTVEVLVPDPNIVTELSRSQDTVTMLRTEIMSLSQEISDLKGEISKQNHEILQQKGRITELESQLATMSADGVVAVGTAGPSVSSEEMEELKKENRELKRDMKKMIKHYERLREREQNSSGDSTGLEEQLGSLDNKIADLEAENEALKEEKVILRERLRTEVITITQLDDRTRQLEEKDNKIEDLTSEVERLRQENQEMHKDIKKMIKSHSKSKSKLESLQGSERAAKLLEIIAMLVHQIHGQVPDAASQVNMRLDDVENQMIQVRQNLEDKKKEAEQWSDKYKKMHGKEPKDKDRDAEGTKLHKEFDDAKKQFKEKLLHVAALELMKTGDITTAVDKPASSIQVEHEVERLEKQLTAADNKMIDLEAENSAMKASKEEDKNKMAEMVAMIEDLKNRAEVQATLAADAGSCAELTQQLGEMQTKCDGFEAALMTERMSHVNTQEELENVRKQMVLLREEMDNQKAEVDARLHSSRVTMEAEIQAKEEELRRLKDRVETLETEKLSKLPPDTAAEIKVLQTKLKAEQEDKSSSSVSSKALQAQLAELTVKLDVATKNLEATRASNREMEAKMKSSRNDKEKEVKKMSRHHEEKEQKRASDDKNRINVLIKRVKELEAAAGKGGGFVAGAAVGRAAAGGGAGDKGLKDKNKALKVEVKELNNRIKQLELEARSGPAVGVAAGAAQDKHKNTRQEKILKELEKRLEMEKMKTEKIGEGLSNADEENKTLRRDVEKKAKEVDKLQTELKMISVAAKEGVEAATKVKDLEKSLKKLTDENNVLMKNFESERVLRKKYYNMVEDMKGKIRVYCRARPLSGTERKNGNHAVVNSLDEYSISVETSRGLKEFQYDQVFMEDSTQEKIFEDTNNLIQSAVDGYNVCIFAYGQTGSGKTFTMIGDREQNFPGIAPRAFTRIFDLIHDLRSKFTFKVQAYMMELYNEKLIDLFAKPGVGDDAHEKLDIKKDKKGLVYVQGAVVKDASNAKELFALFEEGSTNRHTASTKMNAESSRSHLVIGIIMESTNRNTGNITTGKLSLVDLAGSERVAKTGAGAEQLKEAMSINKSLSALGDVISALSSEQQFIPYRNNKLTMLMQDSLGGNAKTLMFVNISPADYNCDETVISLTYASRVKLITNDASKNADNKEIARLKNVIAKLKHGEQVGDDEI